MEKSAYYFIFFHRINGTCAVKRHLASYISAHLDHCVIESIQIDQLLADLKNEQTRYLSGHSSAKSVRIRKNYHGEGITPYSISVGELDIYFYQVYKSFAII